MTPEIAPENPTPVPRRGHFHKAARDEYNQTSRQMTPVYHYADGGTLWLGGETAANNLDMLYLNGMLELWDIGACRRAKGIEDMFLYPPSRIDDTRLSCALVDWHKMKEVVIDLEAALRRGENILVFCRQGAPCSVTVVGTYLMAKTGASAKNVYNYLRALRAVVEDAVLWNLENGPGKLQLHVDWIEQKTFLPLVPLIPRSRCWTVVSTACGQDEAATDASSTTSEGPWGGDASHRLGDAERIMNRCSAWTRNSGQVAQAQAVRPSLLAPQMMALTLARRRRRPLVQPRPLASATSQTASGCRSSLPAKCAKLRKS